MSKNITHKVLNSEDVQNVPSYPDGYFMDERGKYIKPAEIFAYRFCLPMQIIVVARYFTLGKHRKR